MNENTAESDAYFERRWKAQMNMLLRERHVPDEETSAMVDRLWDEAQVIAEQFKADLTASKRPLLRIPEGCICAYAWRSLGRVYDQDMGEAWVRASTERTCPLHGDDRPRRPSLRVIPPEATHS